MEQSFPPEAIETERLYLLKHKVDVAQTMIDYVNKDRTRLAKFLPWVDHVSTVEDEVKFIQLCDENWFKYTNFDFGMWRKADNTYLGNIGVHSMNWRHEFAEFGYWILGEFEGFGYVTESVLGLEKYLFQMGFNRVIICCDARNQKSSSVPKRCGYTFEGISRQDHKLGEGQFRDTMTFSKLKSEYIKM